MSKIEVSLDDATQAYARYQELNPRGHNEEFEGIVGEIRELDLLVPDQVEAVQEQRRLLLQTRYFRTLFESLVAQLEDNPDWADNRADSDETVEEAPRTFLKTVEDILVKPEDRMAVAREDEGGIDIDSMIISPERITPTLLKNLGLEEHLPPKGTKRVKRIKAYAAAIPAIKEMLSHLEPIRYPGTEDHTEESNLRYFRLMRMGAGPNEGMILGTQNVRKTDDNERGEKVLFKTDLHASERRVLHIYESYREEMRKLASIEEGLRGVRKTLSNWTADKVRDNEHRLATMKQELLKIAATLNPQIIQNRHKRAIAREISLSLTLKDSLDRYNPLIIGDRLDRAIDRIGERFKEIERISGFLGGDQARVTALTELQEAPLSAFCELVNELHEKFKLFERRPLGDDEKEVVLRNLNLTKEKAERLNYEPYLSLAKNFIERIDRVIDLLTTGPTEDFSQPAHQLAAEEFVKAYLVSKVAHAYRDLQTVYRKSR